MSEYLVQGNSLTAIADAIRARTGGTDALTLDAMAEAIASIETGNGGSAANAYKAFDTQPTSTEPILKKIVPFVSDFAHQGTYTQQLSTLKIQFYYRKAGDVVLAAAALRSPTEEPTLPDGWMKIAFIEPPEGNTSDQWLFIARHVVTEEESGGVYELTLNVTSGVRNYLLGLYLFDCDIETENVRFSKASNVESCEIALHEHTLLICSSSTATADPSTARVWVSENGNYHAQEIFPNYVDGSSDGGRLAAVTIPWREEQKNAIEKMMYADNADNKSNGMIICALELKPTKFTKYLANMEVTQ